MLSAENLTAGYEHHGNHVVALRDLTLEVRTGEILCVLGPSGCGKSTLLSLLGGFRKPQSGVVRHNGRLVDIPDPKCGIVFQQLSLFPWLTARGNIEFGPRLRGVPTAERRIVSDRYLELTGLARAFANDPQILLLDEPFAALDVKTRMDMGRLLSQFCAESPKAVVFVTHDVDEAILLGDRVLVLTARPGTTKTEFRVDLPRPRIPAIAFGSVAFDFRKEIFECVFGSDA
jgi:NitT/TauT family transport system ATP-binding protein